jgi:hypothetical protein
MAILTIPTLHMSAAQTISLNKASLASHAKVAADTHFGNQSNWENVSVLYKSTTSNQYKSLLFKVADSVPTCILSASDSVDTSFDVFSLTIRDKDLGEFIIYKADLVASEFALSFLP